MICLSGPFFVCESIAVLVVYFIVTEISTPALTGTVDGSATGLFNNTNLRFVDGVKKLSGRVLVVAFMHVHKYVCMRCVSASASRFLYFFFRLPCASVPGLLAGMG